MRLSITFFLRKPSSMDEKGIFSELSADQRNARNCGQCYLSNTKKGHRVWDKIISVKFPMFLYVCEKEIWLTLQNFIHEANESCH